MSSFLTGIIPVIFVLTGLSFAAIAGAVHSLWRHKVAAALAYTSSLCSLIYVGLQLAALAGWADYYEHTTDAAITGRVGEYVGWSILPDWFLNLFGWAAIVFLALSLIARIPSMRRYLFKMGLTSPTISERIRASEMDLAKNGGVRIA